MSHDPFHDFDKQFRRAGIAASILAFILSLTGIAFVVALIWGFVKVVQHFT